MIQLLNLDPVKFASTLECQRQSKGTLPSTGSTFPEGQDIAMFWCDSSTIHHFDWSKVQKNSALKKFNTGVKLTPGV